jgi:insulysin
VYCREQSVSLWKTSTRRYVLQFEPVVVSIFTIIQYLVENNGSSNAYTGTTNTNYYFKVATSALPGALERFSAFFHCPLFSPGSISRELNAVDSEHKKNNQADMWRIFQLNKHLSRPGHVWSKFGTGHRDSLSKTARELKKQGKLAYNSPDLSLASTPLSSRSGSPAPSVVSSLSVSSNNSEKNSDGGVVGRETRRRLMEWWSREYCASRMRLCIVGKGGHLFFIIYLATRMLMFN